MKAKRMTAVCLAGLMTAGVLTACAGDESQAVLDAKNHIYETFSPAAYLNITFPDMGLVLPEIRERTAEEKADETVVEPFVLPDEEPNFVGVPANTMMMRTYGEMNLYTEVGAALPSGVLASDTVVQLTELDDGWAQISTTAGVLLGYANDGFMHAMDSDCMAYAELPIEYGQARTNAGTMVNAYSHLVDVRKYFRTYESTSGDFSKVDLTNIDFVISMQLSTEKTSINQPFYYRNLCMLQYDILPMLRAAIDQFKKDGYTVIIYDAYRPTSVQQRWFDVVRVHKWVADPSIGMGGVHDRGTAIDMSLIDSKGNLLEMPTPMHTFTEESSRLSETMTDEARKNMDYMLSVMVQCGFTYINSEWWHFQDVNTMYYLPTDHPIDTIPMVVSEK